MFVPRNVGAQRLAALSANLSALVFDFVARHKVGGTHLNFFIIKQLPVLPPEAYSESNLAYIVPRVLELTYTAHDLKPFAEDLGYHGDPFPWNPDRRHQLKSELDAYYARLYGLDRDELRYILDPADVMGDDYPSVTFPTLKRKEIAEFGEYRTRTRVLAEFDRLAAESNKASESPVATDHVYPGHDWLAQVYCGVILTALRYGKQLSQSQLERVTAYTLDTTLRQQWLPAGQNAAALPANVPTHSGSYDISRAIQSLKLQGLIRPSTGDQWCPTDTQNNGTALILPEIHLAIAQAVQVDNSIETASLQGVEQTESVRTDQQSATGT